MKMTRQQSIIMCPKVHKVEVVGFRRLGNEEKIEKRNIHIKCVKNHKNSWRWCARDDGKECLRSIKMRAMTVEQCAASRIRLVDMMC